MADNDDAPPFGQLLRQFRDRQGLTQEELAERAGLSTDAIGLLERGERQRPQRQTVRQLADALALAGPERARFEEGARKASRRGAGDGNTPLPAPLTSFVGRAEELAAVQRLFTAEHARLVTLTGPGGVGKTRLGLAVAAQLTTAFDDGIAFAPLATLHDGAMLAPTLARTLGARPRAGESPLAAIGQRVGGRRLLLVLDNVEQLPEAGEIVAAILAACPRLAVLATSRTPLRLGVERQFPLAPLALPSERPGQRWEDQARLPAVALFAERARAVAPAFALTATNTAAIVAICRRLDGLPLAIELAAPWLRVLPPSALLARLDQRLPLLVGGARDLPPRQQALRDTIAWSDGLLPVAARTLLRRLAVFVGGGTLAALAAVCADEGAEPAAVLLNVSALVDASLLLTAPSGAPHADADDPRFLILELVREYAVEQLAASGEEEGLRRRHADHYLALVERAQAHLIGPDEGIWLARLGAEHPNLRAALRWTLDRGEATMAVRFAAVLWRFWAEQAHFGEGRRWLEEVMALARRSGESAATEGGGVSAAQYAMLLHVTGNLARTQGDYGYAETLYGECLEIRRGLDDRHGIGGALHNLGIVAHEQGAYDLAARRHEEALGILRALNDPYGIAFVLASLGDTSYATGALTRAQALYAESRDRFQQLGHSWGMAQVLGGLGDVARRLDDPRRAGEHYRAMLALSGQLGDRRTAADGLERLALTLATAARYDFAALLCGAAEALRDATGSARSSLHQGDHDGLIELLRAQLGAAFATHWREGAEQPFEPVIAQATEETD